MSAVYYSQLFFIFYTILSYLVETAPVIFKATHSVVRKVPNGFSTFYERPETPQVILSLNPGLIRIEPITESVYMGYLAPIEFPGLRIKSIVRFDVTFKDKILEVNCREGALQQNYEGNKLFVSAVSKLVYIRIVVLICFVRILFFCIADPNC